jgi:hypothetical protein
MLFAILCTALGLNVHGGAYQIVTTLILYVTGVAISASPIASFCAFFGA